MLANNVSQLVQAHPLITWIIALFILGFIAGAIVKLIYPGYQERSRFNRRRWGGFFGTASLGLFGYAVGGTLYKLIKYHTLMSLDPVKNGQILSWGTLGITILGAIVVIFVWGLVTGRTES